MILYYLFIKRKMYNYCIILYNIIYILYLILWHRISNIFLESHMYNLKIKKNNNDALR